MSGVLDDALEALDKIPEPVKEAAGRLIPYVMRALLEGQSEGDLRKLLARNRQSIEDGADDALDRIRRPR